MTRRPGQILIGLVAVACSIAACTAGDDTPTEPSVASEAPTPVSSSTPKQKPPDNNYFRWAKSLRRGEDAELAYDNNGVIYTPGNKLRLPNGEGVAFGAVSQGWLVSLHLGISNSAAETESGLLRADGSFTALPMAPLRQHLTLAVSPDGMQYITGNDVRSTITGAIEATIPAVTVKQSVRWTEKGLTFLGKGDRPWVWIGQGRPLPLPVRPWGIQQDGWLFKAADKTCSTAYKLNAGGTLTNRYQLCAEARGGLIDSASPSGRRGITRDLRVLSLPSGAEIATIEQPGPGWTAYPVKWESNDAIVVWTPGPDSRDKQTSTGLLLRCLVSSGTCEQASPVIRDSWPYIAYLPFPGYGSPIF